MRSKPPARKNRKREPVCMFIMPGPLHEREVIGLHAVPNRMEQVLRLPGETLAMMEKRAVHSVTGGGDLVVFPMVRT